MPVASGNGEAIDDGEYVGFGCTMPIVRRRSAKSWVMNSGRSGPESARIAVVASALATDIKVEGHFVFELTVILGIRGLWRGP